MIPFRTISGVRVDLECLRASDVSIVDIACALSRCCRFAGHVSQFYSVAQHSLLVASLVEPELRFAALLHDASEAYLGDLSRHLKHSVYLEGYRVLEDRVQAAISEHFHLDYLQSARIKIKRADDITACFEHVILRKGRARFDQLELTKLIMEGFVKADFDHLAPMIDLLPEEGLPALRIDEVESRFLTSFEQFS